MNWPTVEISRFCQTGSGGTPSRNNAGEYYEGSIPWVKSGELNQELVLDTEECITEKALRESSAKLVPAGAILVAMYGATVGKTALLGVDAATNQAICNIIPEPEIADTRYVWYALKNQLPYLLAQRVGGAQPNISQQIIKRTPIPLPPLSEQRRIVEILGQADQLRKLRAEADKKAERILPALFIKMFGDPVANPNCLEKRPIGELIRVRSGNFLPAKNMAPNGKFPVYGGNGINGFHSSFMFQERKIVIGRVGAYCGAVHFSEPNCWVTDNALYVSDKLRSFEDEYLAFALHHANLNRYAGQAGQPLISASRINPVEILVPEESDQKKFASAYRGFEKLNAERTKSREMIERTFSLLLRKAFSGDLTAAWREAHMKELLAEMEQQAKYLN